jgi:hypothetical protein
MRKTPLQNNNYKDIIATLFRDLIEIQTGALAQTSWNVGIEEKF